MFSLFRNSELQIDNVFIFDGDQTDNLFLEFLRALEASPDKYQRLTVFYVKSVNEYRRPVKVPANLLELVQLLAGNVVFHFKLNKDVATDQVINGLCQVHAASNVWVFSGDKRLKSTVDSKVKFQMMIPDQV